MAMVEHLPALPRDRLEPFIIELDESVQAALLWRSDIELTNLRRAIFLGDREVKSAYLVEAAASHHLELTEEDVPRLRFPDDFRKRDLKIEGKARATAFNALKSISYRKVILGQDVG